ncbi:MAG: hypothetical protein R3338_11980, partial [Thermoanaerobaculia bacterium]|nr:hypothetical protein [Thermoanaerobaculia bacterium]
MSESDEVSATDDTLPRRPEENESPEDEKEVPESVALKSGGALDLVVRDLLEDLKAGKDDGDNRRQVEDWLRALSDKYPEFEIESGLRDYYLAEADRLRE